MAIRQRGVILDHLDTFLEQRKTRQTITKTEVINYTSVFNLSLRILNNRWSVMVDVPISNNVRSSLYEHGL
jgi:hypothetical protein